MNNISKEYHFKNGAFYRRSKITKYIRMMMVTTIILGGVFSPKLFSQEADIDKTTLIPITAESRYVDHIKQVNPNISDEDANQIVEAVTKWSKRFKVDEKLIIAVMEVESRFTKYSISPSGAVGLMQVLFKTHLPKIVAARDEVGTPEPFDISTNIYLGSWVLADCGGGKKNSHLKILQCYNGGEAVEYTKKVQSIIRKIS